MLAMGGCGLGGSKRRGIAAGHGAGPRPARVAPRPAPPDVPAVRSCPSRCQRNLLHLPHPSTSSCPPVRGVNNETKDIVTGCVHPFIYSVLSWSSLSVLWTAVPSHHQVAVIRHPLSGPMMSES